MIRTERLLLRGFLPTDGQALYAMLSDPLVVRFEPYAPFTLEASHQEALRRSGDKRFFAVCLPDSSLIGSVYLDRQPYDTCEIGYVFARPYWGQGYATEAVTAMIDDAITKGAHRICAQCNPENTASWRLMERLGMRREAHLVQNIFFNEAPPPQWQDTYIYAILASEWRCH